MKRKIAMGLAMSMLTSVFLLSGCSQTDSGSNGDTGNTSGGSGNSGGNTTSGTDSSLGSPISMQLCYWDTDVPTGNELLIQEIEKATGVDLEFSWYPPSAATEKTTTTIASGLLPEVLEIINGDMRSQIVVDAMNGGMFWDLTDYIDDYPNLASISENTYNAMKYDGRVYTIPRMIPSRDNGLVIRQDWLENLGFDMPETLEDYYDVLVAFKYDDPDGNGVDDTRPMHLAVGCVVAPLVLAAGCPIDWWVDDSGNVRSMDEHPQYMVYLDFMKKLYDEELVNGDFTAATAQTNVQEFMAGNVGMIAGSVGQVTQGTYFATLFDRDPDAVIRASSASVGPDGNKYANPNPGFWGMYAISKAEVQSEERLREILQFFDDLMRDDVMDIFTKGIEGTHYTEENGKFEWIDKDQYVIDSKGTSAFYVSSVITAQLNLGVGEFDSAYYDWETDTTAIEFPQLGSYFVTPTDIITSNIVTVGANDYVMGEITKAELEDICVEWHTERDGDRLCVEFTEQYKVLTGG